MNDSRIQGSGPIGSATPSLFREVQRFKHWIFALPVTAVTVIVWYIFIQQIVLGHPQGDNPVPDWLAWALTMVFGFGFPAFALTVKLVTEVRPGEVVLRLFPFRGRAIPAASISTAEVRQYSPLGEYGGWGIRLSRRNGRAYNAYGNLGVQLVLTDGTRVLIGSQQPEQLLAALRQAGGALRPVGPRKRG